MTEPGTNQMANQCPQCGLSLPPGALEGLCPACLLKEATTESATEVGNKPFEPPGVPELTRLFPQLEILTLLGKGGMGAVYKARQPDLDRFVALKILPSETGAGSAERFTREARALARLSHPNIVAVYDFGRVDGLNYFIMEYVDGVNIRQLEKGARISPRQALQIIPQICDALQYAHDEGVVHRDIKPENVLVDRKGRVKVADFGLAKILNRQDLRLTGEGQVMGTLHYMAPEQVEHPLEVDHRADIFSLGVVLYEMLTGELPLGKFPPPSRMVRVDVRLDEVVLRSLEKKPEQRYQHASEVKSDVQTIANAPASEPKTVLMKPSPACMVAFKQVSAPAIALIGLGVLGLALPFVLPVRGLGNGSIHFSIFGFGYHHLSAPRLASVAFWLSSFMPLAHLVMLVAGLRMRRLQSLVLSRIGACLALLAFPFQPIGVPLGIWALIVLNRREVHQEFREMDSGEVPKSVPHFSRLAMAGAGMALLPTLAMSLPMFFARLSHIANPFADLTWFYSLMAPTQPWCPLGAVTLGWIALEDIRKGTRRGAGLAWFDVLFFACDWGFRHATNNMEWSEDSAAERVGYALTADLLSLALCAAVGYWIHVHEAERFRSGEIRSAKRRSNVGVWLARGLACGALALTLLAVGRQIEREMARVSSQINLDAFIAHSHANPPGSVANGRFVIPLDGGQVRLEALSELSAGPPVCWKPDGAVLCSPAANSPQHLGPMSSPRSLVLTLDLAISAKMNLASAATTQRKSIEPGLFDGMPYLPFQLWVASKPVEMTSSAFRGEREFIAFHAPANASMLDFRVGEPVGDWQEAFISWEWTGKIPSHQDRTFQCSGQKAQVSLGQVSQTVGNGSCEATWFSRLFPAEWVGRLVAVDEKGIVHEPTGNMVNRTTLMNASTEGLRAYTVSFEGLDPARIREFRFQIRPCQWVVMSNISLRDGMRTEAEIGEMPAGAGGFACVRIVVTALGGRSQT
jgi:serine/threonine protein kinase